MAVKLHKYQEDAVVYAVENLFERNNSLIVAGTGAGKTYMMSAVIGRFIPAFKSKFDRLPHTLVLVHRNEIHEQNRTKFQKLHPDIATSEITAGRKSLHGLVHFGMVQTVVGMIEKLPAFDLIVVDEAHHSMAETYKQIISENAKKNADMYLLGVTATPNRGDKLPLIELFDNARQITTKFLIDSHYLVRPKFIDLSPRFEILIGDEIKTEIGRLNKNLLKQNAEAAKRIDDMIEMYLKHKENGKTIIYAPTHEFCGLIMDALIRRGRKPAYLSLGLSSDDRAAEFDRFKHGDAEELVNVDIATEGFDFPELRNIVDFDTNGNETQWIQKVGRVLRIALGKTSCTVIDFGGNLEMYPDCEVDINLNGEIKKNKGERLTANDFFKSQDDGKKDVEIIEAKSNNNEATPYAPPKGFETVNDEDCGIVFIACASRRDALIIKRNGVYELYATDKENCKFWTVGTFEECAAVGEKWIRLEEPNFENLQTDKPISNMQIKRLAPKHPTMTLTWYGANCLICWETWKSEIMGGAHGKVLNGN